MDCCNKGRIPFIYTLIHCTMSLAFVLLFLSSPLLIPNLLSSLKSLLFFLPPKLSEPKCIFVVCNMIIVYLLGESKWSGRRDPGEDVYMEYMEFSRRNQGVDAYATTRGMIEEEEEERKMMVVEDKRVEHENVVEVVEGVGDDDKEKGNREEEEVVKVVEFHEGKELAVADGDDMERLFGLVEEEEHGLPVEELNRRVEEFIEKVKQQRRMEELNLLCR